MEWVDILTGLRLSVLFVGFVYTIRVRNYLAVLAVGMLFTISLLNSVFHVPNVIAFMGTPFTFVFVLLILKCIGKDH